MNRYEPSKESAVNHHILIAIVGLSPAVLTETVFELSNSSDQDIPDRIIVITTTEGHRKAKQVLFDNGAWAGLLQSLEATHGADSLRGKLRFGPVADCMRIIPKQQLDGDLDDIKSTADNKAVADFMLQQLSGLCSQDNIRITASIAGGRKTMGALLLTALSMVGRPQDRAIHILVSEPWDRIPDFTFPGCTGNFRCPNTGNTLLSSDAKLVLADVPFVPLRRLFEHELNLDPNDLYRLADRLTFSSPQPSANLSLCVDTKAGNISVGDACIKLSALEFAFIGTLAQLAKDKAPVLAQYIDLEEPLLEFVKQHTTPDNFGHWSHRIHEGSYDAKDAYRKAASNLRGKLKRHGIRSFDSEAILPSRGCISMRLKPENITIL